MLTRYNFGAARGSEVLHKIYNAEPVAPFMEILHRALAFITSSFRVTEENLVLETVQSGPYSSFECFLFSLRN